MQDQQFCRSCGISLIEKEKRSFNPRFWGLGVLMLIFTGLLIAVTGKMIGVRWLSFAGLFVMIIGMFFVAAFAMMREMRPRKSKTVPSQPMDSLPPAETTKKLSPIGDFGYIPSVTEGTTNLLDEKVPATGKAN